MKAEINNENKEVKTEIMERNINRILMFTSGIKALLFFLIFVTPIFWVWLGFIIFAKVFISIFVLYCISSLVHHSIDSAYKQILLEQEEEESDGKSKFQKRLEEAMLKSQKDK